jgi:RNA polymerase-binding transcription factor DksA
MLNSAQLATFRRRLLEERRAIEARIAARARDLSDTVRTEEGVGDTEDEAQRVYDREDDIVANELEEQQLVQVDKALARIADGTYGTSEVSGKPIPVDRLDAVPSATTLAGEEPV